MLGALRNLVNDGQQPTILCIAYNDLRLSPDPISQSAPLAMTRDSARPSTISLAAWTLGKSSPAGWTVGACTCAWTPLRQWRGRAGTTAVFVENTYR